MDITLVRATAEDVGEYVRIGRLAISRFNTVTIDAAGALREIEESVVYMIQTVTRVIGFISYIRPSPEHAYIAEVQVEPDFRGCGAGGYALDVVLKELHEVALIDLHTHPENPAQRLYRRHGFQETGEIIQNYHDTGEPRMRMVLKRP